MPFRPFLPSHVDIYISIAASYKQLIYKMFFLKNPGEIYLQLYQFHFFEKHKYPELLGWLVFNPENGKNSL